MESLRGYTLDDWIYFHEARGVPKVPNPKHCFELSEGTLILYKQMKRPGKRSVNRNAPKKFKSAMSSWKKSAPTSIIGRFPATRGSRTRGVEIKAVDMPAINGGADTLTKQITTTATFDLLNGVQEGASFYNRIGRRTHMKSIHVTGNFISGAGTGGTGEYNRTMLVYDRQPNGGFPGIADLLLDYGNDGTTFTTSRSKMNLNNVERFAILRDSRQATSEANNGVASAFGQDFPGGCPQPGNQLNWYVPLKDLETHYKSTTNPAAIGDVATGALYLVTFGSSAPAANGCAFSYNARLRFIDV